jgi:hypothetical protein
MKFQAAKAGPKAADPDDLIEAAIQDGRSEGKSDIDSMPVHRELTDITSHHTMD